MRVRISTLSHIGSNQAADKTKNKMTSSKIQSPKQKLAAMLRRTEYKGCTGQVSHHGAGRVSVQIFAPAADSRFANRPMAASSTTSRLVADINL